MKSVLDPILKAGTKMMVQPHFPGARTGPADPKRGALQLFRLKLYPICALYMYYVKSILIKLAEYA